MGTPDAVAAYWVWVQLVFWGSFAIVVNFVGFLALYARLAPRYEWRKATRLYPVPQGVTPRRGRRVHGAVEEPRRTLRIRLHITVCESGVLLRNWGLVLALVTPRMFVPWRCLKRPYEVRRRFFYIPYRRVVIAIEDTTMNLVVSRRVWAGHFAGHIPAEPRKP